MTQTLVALVPAIWFYVNSGIRHHPDRTFFQGRPAEPGNIFHPLCGLFIVGTANAVNLTDGLDGLAIGPVTIAAAFYMIFCYLAGNIKDCRVSANSLCPGGGRAVHLPGRHGGRRGGLSVV